MSNVLQVAELAAMVGDPARANMLFALADGRALPAGELAFQARISPQTASGHFAQLVAAGLLSVVRQGRHRYYRLGSPEVAAMLEGMMAVAASAPPRRQASSGPDAALRQARTCYNHFAGRLGVALADRLAEAGHVALDEEGGRITPRGLEFFADFGIDLRAARRRPVCRTCIDWSERRPHLSGRLGAGICARCQELGWVARRPDSRAVSVTETGRREFRAVFGLQLP